MDLDRFDLQLFLASACSLLEIIPAMSRRVASFLLAAAVVFSVHCSGEITAKAIPRAIDPSVLHPINLRSYEAALGLQRRSGEDFAELDPSTQSQLIYGRPGGM